MERRHRQLVRHIERHISTGLAGTAPRHALPNEQAPPGSWDGAFLPGSALVGRSGAVGIIAELGEVHVQVRLERLGHDGDVVGGVLTEPADVLRQVRRGLGQVLRLDLLPRGLELANDLGDVEGVLEDHTVGQQ